jgi:hypothetical protein
MIPSGNQSYPVIFHELDNERENFLGAAVKNAAAEMSGENGADGADIEFFHSDWMNSGSFSVQDVESLFDLSTVKDIDETGPVRYKRKRFRRPKSVLRGNHVDVVEEEFEVLEEEAFELSSEREQELTLPLFRGCGDRRMAPAMPMLKLEMMYKEYNEPVRDRDKNWTLESYRPILDGPATAPLPECHQSHHDDAIASLQWSTTFKSLIRRSKLLRKCATISETPCVVTIYGVGINGRVFSDGGSDHRVIYIEAYSIWNSKLNTIALNMVQIKNALAWNPGLFKPGMKAELLATLVKQLYFDYTLTLFPVPHIVVPDEADLGPDKSDGGGASDADGDTLHSNHALPAAPTVASVTHLFAPKVPKIGPQTVGDVIRGITDAESLPPGMPVPQLVQNLKVADKVLVNGATKRRRLYAAKKREQEDEFERQKREWLAVPKRLRGFVVANVVRSMGRFALLSAYRMPLRPKVISVRALLHKECIKLDISVSLALMNTFYAESPNHKYWEKQHIRYYSLRTLRKLRLDGDPFLPYLQLVVNAVTGSGTGAEELPRSVLQTSNQLLRIKTKSLRAGTSINDAGHEDYDASSIRRRDGSMLTKSIFTESNNGPEATSPTATLTGDGTVADDATAATNDGNHRLGRLEDVLSGDPYAVAKVLDVEAAAISVAGNNVTVTENPAAVSVDARSSFPPVNPVRLVRTATFRMIPSDEVSTTGPATVKTEGEQVFDPPIWQALSHSRRPVPFSSRQTHRPFRCLRRGEHNFMELTSKSTMIGGIACIYTCSLRVPLIAGVKSCDWPLRWQQIEKTISIATEEKIRLKAQRQKEREERLAKADNFDDLLFDTNNDDESSSAVEDDEKSAEDGNRPQSESEELKNGIFSEIPDALQLCIDLYFPYSRNVVESDPLTRVPAQAKQLLRLRKDDLLRMCTDTIVLLDALSVCYRSFHVMADSFEVYRIHKLWEQIASAIMRRTQWVQLPAPNAAKYESLRDIYASIDAVEEDKREAQREAEREARESERAAALAAAEEAARLLPADIIHGSGDDDSDNIILMHQPRDPHYVAVEEFGPALTAEELAETVKEESEIRARNHRAELLDSFHDTATSALSAFVNSKTAEFLVAEDVADCPPTSVTLVRVGISCIVFRRNCKLASQIDGQPGTLPFQVVVWQRGQELGVNVYDILRRKPNLTVLPDTTTAYPSIDSAAAHGNKPALWTSELEALLDCCDQINTYSIQPSEAEQQAQIGSIRFLSSAERGITLSMWIQLELQFVETTLDEAVMDDQLQEHAREAQEQAEAEARAAELLLSKGRLMNNDDDDMSSDWGEGDDHADDWKLETEDDGAAAAAGESEAEKELASARNRHTTSSKAEIDQRACSDSESKVRITWCIVHVC